MSEIPAFEGDHYTTVVIRHESAGEARAFTREILERFPMFTTEGARTTMIGCGDAASSADAARMVLGCRQLDRDERIDCALEVLECPTWDACCAKFKEWELDVLDGELVDARGEAA